MAAPWVEVAAFRLYRAASWVAAPLVNMLVYCRRWQGLEHPSRWPERFGRPSCPRPPGQLLWFHAVSLAVGNFSIPAKAIMEIEDLQRQFCSRPVWMATSIHKCEQGVVLGVHEELMRVYPDLLTVIVPRHPQHGQQMMLELKRQGINVALRSKSETISPRTSVYVVDTLGELRSMYRVTPIAVIGGSFAPCLGGHNISEAAAAGCAVLTGPHVGHFSHMVMKLLQSDSLSVLQVEGKRELAEAVSLLLGDAEALKARQIASRRAFSLVSEGVIQSVWNLMDTHVLNKGCC